MQATRQPMPQPAPPQPAPPPAIPSAPSPAPPPAMRSTPPAAATSPSLLTHPLTHPHHSSLTPSPAPPASLSPQSGSRGLAPGGEGVRREGGDPSLWPPEALQLPHLAPSPTIFRPAQIYVRESRHQGRWSREFGEVISATPTRVIMAVTDAIRRHTGTETFSPKLDTNWRPCG